MNQKSFNIRKDLALAYQILQYLNLDDHTYTHLSARSERGFFIYPFGLLFSQVTSDNLLEVTLDGKVIYGSESQYNKTGYIIHGQIYKQRPDINAIFHLHTPEIVAVSSYKNGLMPSSQWALHFYNQIAYHDYDSLALSFDQGKRIAEDLKNYFVILLRNHGSITCGRTIQEAMFYTYHLQQACKTQVLTLGMTQKIDDIIMPSNEICQNTVQDLLAFEKNLGERDWKAWVKLINADTRNNDANIIEELIAREPIFNQPENFRRARQDIETQICDEFTGITSNGKIYAKQEVVETLFEHYNNVNYTDIWETSEFQLIKIAADNYLLNYNLLHNKITRTRRSTIWRNVNGKWKILFHQGTVI